VTEQVQLLVIAGDLYDGDWRDYSTGLFFNKQMAVLRAAGVQVVWIRGNHDAASKLTAHLALPDNTRELSHKKAGIVLTEALGVACMVRASALGRDARSERALPEPKRDLFNNRLLHTALEGRPGHASTRPVG